MQEMLGSPNHKMIQVILVQEMRTKMIHITSDKKSFSCKYQSCSNDIRNCLMIPLGGIFSEIPHRMQQPGYSADRKKTS